MLPVVAKNGGPGGWGGWDNNNTKCDKQGGGQIKLIPGATEGRREGRIDGTEILGGAQTSPGVNKANQGRGGWVVLDYGGELGVI